MRTRETVEHRREPASAEATCWVRLDVLVVAGVAVRRPGMVAALRAAGHRVRVVATTAPAIAALGEDLPDGIVADRAAGGACGLGAAVALVDLGIPVFHPDPVRAALEEGRAHDLFGPFDLGGLA
jgi:hypothetical protein